jgi:hypothetical protein
LSQLIDEIQRYVRSGDLQGANNLFLKHLGDRSLLELTDGADLELVAFFLETVLPLTLEDHPSLVISSPELASRYRSLLKEAETLGYAPEKLKRHKLSLRCLEAIQAVMGGEREQVLLAAEENGFTPLLLNGDLPPPGVSYDDAESYFRGYFDRAKKREDDRLVKEISAIVFDLLSRLKREETVPGITRGLFVDGLTGRGEIRRILARVELGDGSIGYATLGGEEISESLKAAAQNAWVASNSYLLSNSYVEGLKGRRITWQITDLDVRAENLRTFYDGASMGFPLSMAIISAYLRRPVPASVAFTGAFDITSAREGKLVKVGGVLSKCKAAIEKGFRSIFIPQGNEVDIDLSIQKEAEREGYSISFVDSVSQVSQKIFGDSGKKSTREMIREALSDLWGILTFRSRKPFLKQNLVHIWASSLLFACMYFMEGLLVYNVAPTLPVPESVFYGTTIPACLVAFLGLLLAYGIVPLFLNQQRQDSWYVSLVLFAVVNLVAFILFLQMVRGETPDLSRFQDWPASLGIFKDLLVFWVFTAFFITNLFNFAAALDYLARRYQVITVQNCLNRPTFIHTDVPVKLLGLPWNWAILVAMVGAALMMTFEMVTYWSLHEGMEATTWFITLGLLRDFVFIILAIEVLIWYRNALTSVSRRIMEV